MPTVTGAADELVKYVSGVRLELTVCVACPAVAVKLLLPEEVNQSEEAGRFCVARVPSANHSRRNSDGGTTTVSAAGSLVATPASLLTSTL